MAMAQHQNRLARETSPYLLQHAGNPVDWYPWGEEALRRAREIERPIFLSIGYSACHWCHVMERESFEDPATAADLARWFVAIKVDREERTDLDEIYMKAVQALTGSGGWPMSVFLTPELEPFFGGTYFPPDRRHGRPSFREVLAMVAELWAKDRERAREQGRALTEHISQGERADYRGEVDRAVLERALGALVQGFDERWGGFGSAPKFPHAQDIRLCLRGWRRGTSPRALEMATVSLSRMAEGGIYDQLAGGFARYSTDERWLVPHFEKMLYDNALLVPAYLEAHLATGQASFARVARETCDWALAEMRVDGGAFASSLDADSEGEEGRSYAWTAEEIRTVLGPELGEWALAWFGASKEGNWEDGKNVLWRPEPAPAISARLGIEPATLEAAMKGAIATLLEVRRRRPQPARDDKVPVAWNGLMISALGMAYQVLGEPAYLGAARAAARFVSTSMRGPNGRLLATARAGRAHGNGLLDDYVFMVQALIDLYESDFDEAWIRAALELDGILRDHFEDRDKGGTFTTSDDHERLIARLKGYFDGALPSGNGVHALNLLRLAELTGDRALAARAEQTLQGPARLVNQFPQAFAQTLLALDHLAAGPREIVLTGDPSRAEFRALLATVRATFLPQRVVAHAQPDSELKLLPLLVGRAQSNGPALAFVCRGHTCALPARTPAELRAQLV
jgi:uncharacterized protein YyaL (SSP411 family)